MNIEKLREETWQIVDEYEKNTVSFRENLVEASEKLRKLLPRIDALIQKGTEEFRDASQKDDQAVFQILAIWKVLGWQKKEIKRKLSEK